MTYKVEIIPAAITQLGKLPCKIKQRIDRKILSLGVNPKPAGARALKNILKGFYRLRVGDYRIIYRVKAHLLVVVIIRIKHRKDVYRLT